MVVDGPRTWLRTEKMFDVNTNKASNIAALDGGLKGNHQPVNATKAKPMTTATKHKQAVLKTASNYL